MKKYRNGRLIEMTAEEIRKRQEDVARRAVKQALREEQANEQERRRQALNELIDEKLKAR